MNVGDVIQVAGSVSELAAKLRVSHSTICDWKRGNFLPGARVPQISMALGLDANDLLPLVRTPTAPADRDTSAHPGEAA